MSDNRSVVLLTGATGFLGGHLLKALVESGAIVIALARPESNWLPLQHFLPLIVRRDINEIPDVLREFPVDVVIHTATAYGRRGETEAQIRQANIDIPLTILRAALARGVPAFFNTDTFSAKADAGMGACSSYVQTKREFRSRASEEARGLSRFLNVRLEHVYGPDDNPDKFFPMLIRTFLADEPVLELTPCEQRWDCVHVDDVVTAFTTLLAKYTRLPPTDEHVEVGTGASTVLRVAVERIHALCGSKTELRFGAHPARPGTIPESHANTAALNQLGWSARIGLDEGLARTIQATRNNPGQANIRDRSLPRGSPES